MKPIDLIEGPRGPSIYFNHLINMRKRINVTPNIET